MTKHCPDTLEEWIAMTAKEPTPDRPITVHGRSDGLVQTVGIHAGGQFTILQKPEEAEEFGKLLLDQAKWVRRHTEKPDEIGVSKDAPVKTYALPNGSMPWLPGNRTCRHCGESIFTNDAGETWWHGLTGFGACVQKES